MLSSQRTFGAAEVETVGCPIEIFIRHVSTRFYFGAFVAAVWLSFSMATVGSPLDRLHAYTKNANVCFCCLSEPQTHAYRSGKRQRSGKLSKRGVKSSLLDSTQRTSCRTRRERSKSDAAKPGCRPLARRFAPHPSRCSGPPFGRSTTRRVVVRVGGRELECLDTVHLLKHFLESGRSRLVRSLYGLG
jgi:hypothetical protein